MNTKHFFSICLLIALNALSVSTLAESSVWKISKGDKYFYLGGTIHLLSPEDYPLPQAFIDAYRDSDKLIFETDIANADTPESQQKFLSAMTSGSDKTLIDKLDNTTYQQLQDFLASRNIPVENFSRFYPDLITQQDLLKARIFLIMLPQWVYFLACRTRVFGHASLLRFAFL